MVETANFPECLVPYAVRMEIIEESGAHTAREAFGTRKGWSCGLNGNFLDTQPRMSITHSVRIESSPKRST